VILGSRSAFIDTNIWVYSIDEGDISRRDAARDLIERTKAASKIVVSTQVLSEFANVVIKSFGKDPVFTKGYIEILKSFEVCTVKPQTISDAIDICVLNKLSFFDSLLLSSARQAGCGIFYTEDLNHEQEIAGIKITNPFLKD